MFSAAQITALVGTLKIDFANDVDIHAAVPRSTSATTTACPTESTASSSFCACVARAASFLRDKFANSKVWMRKLDEGTSTELVPATNQHMPVGALTRSSALLDLREGWKVPAIGSLPDREGNVSLLSASRALRQAEFSLTEAS